MADTAAIARPPVGRAPIHRLLGYSVALAVLLLDQSIKLVVTSVLQLREGMEVELLPFFRIAMTGNRGISLSMLTADSAATRWLLVLLTATIAGLVAAWLWREKRREDAIALGLVLGGALGNIIDRVRLGYVIDYADLHFGAIQPFLVFNVGDAAITIGVLLLVLRALLTRDRKPPQKDE